MTRTRIDLSKVIVNSCGVNAGVAYECVDALLNSIMEWISEGDELQLRGFGVIYPQKQNARKARVVKKGIMIDVPERIKPKFNPSKAFYTKCNKK